ncbi:unnamed protein product, partial [Closterium sp. Naga37s-1]
MPAPASVDAMRATQWVPRGTDSTTRDSNEGDSNEGIGCMAAGPFQVEHCLAMEGVEAASGKGRVRVRVVQQFTPVNAAAGGRGGGREGGKGGGNEGRGAGAVAVPRLASLAVHREKWVEPFSGGAELADGAALFSSEMVEEGEGSEAVREGRVKEIEGRWEVTAREAQVPTAPSISSSLVALELTEPIQTECQGRWRPLLWRMGRSCCSQRESGVMCIRWMNCREKDCFVWRLGGCFLPTRRLCHGLTSTNQGMQ